MCGIAGIVALDGFNPNLLVSMTQLVSYRGPDGFGFAYFPHDKSRGGEVFHNQVRLPSFSTPVLGLGHRRLSILDLSTLGSQPMQTEDGTVCITFNGEIYNYREIRAELERLGHSFKSQTDTEVILRAYREWGTECFKRFNGMWAFALWDAPRQRLICSRDRFGVKPFYYYAGARSFVFASEIKQILLFPGVRREANERTVIAYLDHAIQDHSAETLFRDVSQLRGGTFLTLDLARQSIVPDIQPYWELPIKPTKLDDREACEEFVPRFTQAVNFRMRSDVPVGSCLSGGLDSSAIVCMARKIVPNHDFHTFSSCSEYKEFDEREYVTEVVRATQVHSHLVFPTPGDFWTAFKRVIWHQDEPVGDGSGFAQWSVMKKARQENVPVLLDGQGGDETLCGYLKFYYFHLWHLLRKGDPRVLTEAAFRVKNEINFLWAWRNGHRYLPGFLNGAPPLSFRVGRPEHRLEHHNGFFKLGPDADIPQRQKADLTCYSLPALLHYEDRNSMAHSIESRHPFLDFELAEFLVNCPTAMKLRHGWSKWIMRQALKGVLPEKVRLRRSKMWFPYPQRQWIKHDLRPNIQELLSSRDLRMSRFLDRRKVRDEFGKFYAGAKDALSDTALFRVLKLELWASVFDVS